MIKERKCGNSSSGGYSYTFVPEEMTYPTPLFPCAVDAYIATINIIDLGNGTTMLSYTGTMTSDKPAEAEATINGLYAGLVAMVQGKFAKAIARPIHDENEELTAAWLTAALNERSHLPAGVTVTSLKFLNLGEGRGYAGKTLKIYDVVYSGAVSLPDTYVLKVPNYMMESIDWGESVFKMCDLGFRQENHFYEKCSAKHPLALPTMYWIGEEPNEDPSRKMPRASILMSIVEDPGMIKQLDGCTEADGKDFLGALAKVQAVWWNSEELDKADWIMSSQTVGNFKEKVMGEALPRLKKIKEFYADMEGGAALYENLLKAQPQIAKFNELCGENGKTMCHGDARTENCLWPNQRKDPLVLIDWQFVSYSSALSDVCYFIGVCLTPEEQNKYADALIKHYYDTLTSDPAGPTTADYPWDTFMLDYKRCMWVSMWVSCMGIANIKCVEEEAEKHKGTETGEAFSTLRDNMVPLLMAFMTRHLNEVNRCGAASVL